MSDDTSTALASGYEHVQTGIVHTLLDLFAAILLIPVAFGLFEIPWIPSLICIAVAVLMIFLSACFRHLTIRDEKDHLSVRFGPVRMFGTKIEYDKITEIEVARTSLIDGWGVHYIPGRGWTYNIRGFRCVRLRLGKKTVHLGTDEPELLADFLKSRVDLSSS